MKRVILVACLVVASAQAAGSKVAHERLRQTTGAVLADTLPDASEVTDRLGYVHRVYIDTSGLWYQTGEFGPSGSPPIKIAQGSVSSPTSFLTCDPEYGWTLVVVWLEKSDPTMAVCCRRRILTQPFWVWSSCLDVTPQRRGRP